MKQAVLSVPDALKPNPSGPLGEKKDEPPSLLGETEDEPPSLPVTDISLQPIAFLKKPHNIIRFPALRAGIPSLGVRTFKKRCF